MKIAIDKMNNIFDKIRKLRDATGAPVMRVKKVLEEIGDLPAKAGEKKVLEILKKEGFEKAQEKQGRETSQGMIFSYIHHSGKIGSMVELFCETDFVARNELFREVGHNLALQVASMGEDNLEDQEFIKDPSKKVIDLIKELVAKTGENIRIGRILRVELGK